MDGGSEKGDDAQVCVSGSAVGGTMMGYAEPLHGSGGERRESPLNMSRSRLPSGRFPVSQLSLMLLYISVSL